MTHSRGRLSWPSESSTRLLAALAVCALLVALPRAAFALGTLDQSSPMSNANFNVASSTLVWQQQIRAGTAGQLAGVTMTFVGAGQVNVRIRLGVPPSTQPILFQQLVATTSTVPQFVDMTASNIALAAGQDFVLEIQGNGSGPWMLGNYIAPPGPPQYPYMLSLNGGATEYAGGGYRLGFQTYMVLCTPSAACNDNNACTTNDVCDATGTSCAGTPVVCTASDQCHAAGTCDPKSGCSNPAVSDGTACNDNSACTQTDTCQAGTCTGTNPILCTAQDTCHTAGTCNPSTGACSNPAKPDGTACTDSNLCDMSPTCVAGKCAGTPAVCAPPDQCHQAGTCDPSTGTCSYVPKSDGTSCDDGNACTTVDACQAGTCMGSSPVVCAAQDGCHSVGTCDTTTGKCSNPSKSDGTACDDGNACTTVDTCQVGACRGSSPVVCTAQDTCHAAGTCDTTTGKCSNPAKSDGATCDDGNACTKNDTCVSGACTGGTRVVCTAMDVCHTAGTCDTTSGKCSNPAKPDGTGCTDNDSCYSGDSCQAGVCTRGAAVTCKPADACHIAGTCDSTSGKCSNPVAPDGTPCPGGACASGACNPLDVGPISTANDGGVTVGPDGGNAATGTTSGCGCKVTSTWPSLRGGFTALGIVLLALRRRRARARRG